MFKFQKYLVVFLAFAAFASSQNVWGQTNRAQNSGAQNNQAALTFPQEFRGSVISFNGPRLATAFFTLRVTGSTSDEQTRQYLGILKDKGQDAALNAIRNNDLGSFSVDNNLGRTINVVRESTVEGRRRVFIVFERWTQFAEQRFGTRSLDYPFGVIELFIDPQTGKGEGTYIAAARIRFDDDAKNGQQTVEIENFGTYPARLTNVTLNRSGK